MKISYTEEKPQLLRMKKKVIMQKIIRTTLLINFTCNLKSVTPIIKQILPFFLFRLLQILSQ